MLFGDAKQVIGDVVKQLVRRGVGALTPGRPALTTQPTRRRSRSAMAESQFCDLKATPGCAKLRSSWRLRIRVVTEATVSPAPSRSRSTAEGLAPLLPCKGAELRGARECGSLVRADIHYKQESRGRRESEPNAGRRPPIGRAAAIAAAEKTGADRRAHQRLRPARAPGPCSARLASGADIRLIDLSRGGAQFETDRRFLPNSSIALRLVTHGLDLRRSTDASCGLELCDSNRAGSATTSPSPFLETLQQAIERLRRGDAAAAAAAGTGRPPAGIRGTPQAPADSLAVRFGASTPVELVSAADAASCTLEAASNCRADHSGGVHRGSPATSRPRNARPSKPPWSTRRRC